MSTNEMFDDIEGEFNEFKIAHEKAASGNKSAATRARKSSSILSKLLKDYRATSIAEGKKS